MYSWILLLHVLAATVWTGGHIVLSLAVMPRALASGEPQVLLDFESRFEHVGMPALLIQAVTGLWMAYAILPDARAWAQMATPAATLILLKLALLTATVLLALDARLRIIPKLSAATLPVMARRAALVTLVSVLFVVVGVSFRGGVLTPLV